jgi:hypothetical protein
LEGNSKEYQKVDSKALELKYIKMWERLRQVTSHSKNYKSYRELLSNILAAQKQQQNSRTPVLPYFGKCSEVIS